MQLEFFELALEFDDPIELEYRSQNIQNLRLNLISGQQCVRDFFLCLNENFLSWPDLFSSFGFNITHSTECCSCNFVNQSETTQMYLELPVPPNDSNLNEYIEDYFNGSSSVRFFCENGCNNVVQSKKISTLTRAAETEFIVVILRRAVETLDGFQLNRNRTIPTNDVLIRLVENKQLFKFTVSIFSGMQEGPKLGMNPHLSLNTQED